MNDYVAAELRRYRNKEFVSTLVAVSLRGHCIQWRLCFLFLHERAVPVQIIGDRFTTSR
jgi:hypothetical protein